MENLIAIKKDEKNTFKFGTLILCLFFYFMNEISGIGHVQWSSDKMVTIQIRDFLYNIGDSKAKKVALWGYFKNFQGMMQVRERIPKSVVEKYQDTICFMVEIDQCLMEVVETRTAQIMPMGYEVEEQILEMYSQHLLSKSVDTSEERFDTFFEKDL